MNLTTLGQISVGYVGTPYIYGGNNPLTGLDCSGFVQIPLKKVGVLHPVRDYYSLSMYHALLRQQFSSCIPEADCILFFGESIDKIEHVAIALDGRFMIEARGGNGQTKTLKDAIKRSAMVEITEIRRRTDLVASIKVEYYK